MNGNNPIDPFKNLATQFYDNKAVVKEFGSIKTWEEYHKVLDEGLKGLVTSNKITQNEADYIKNSFESYEDVIKELKSEDDANVYAAELLNETPPTEKKVDKQISDNFKQFKSIVDKILEEKSLVKISDLFQQLVKVVVDFLENLVTFGRNEDFKKNLKSDWSKLLNLCAQTKKQLKDKANNELLTKIENLQEKIKFESKDVRDKYVEVLHKAKNYELDDVFGLSRYFIDGDINGIPGLNQEQKALLSRLIDNQLKILSGDYKSFMDDKKAEACAAKIKAKAKELAENLNNESKVKVIFTELCRLVVDFLKVIVTLGTKEEYREQFIIDRDALKEGIGLAKQLQKELQDQEIAKMLEEMTLAEEREENLREMNDLSRI